MGKDGLRVTREKVCLDLVELYLKHREKLALLPEEDPANDWTLLNEEERKKREEDKAVVVEEEKKEVDDAAAAKQSAYDALNPTEKLQSR